MEAPVKKRFFFGGLWQVFKKAVIEFFGASNIKFGASLAYYTIFSLPPLLIIIITLCGIFFGPEAVRGEVYGQIAYLVGKDAAIQIQEMIKNVALSGDSTLATTI